MKLSLFIVTIVIVLISLLIDGTQSNCINCIAENGDCTLSGSLGECSYGTFCTAVTSGQTGKCQKQVDEGSSCYRDEECLNNMECVYFLNGDRSCQYSDYLGVGEECEQDYQCSGALVCKDGECKNTQYPKCTLSNIWECSPGQGCINGTCTKLLGYGQVCNTDSECTQDLTCIPYTNTTTRLCLPQFSQQLGQPCSEIHDCDISSGLVCNQNLQCINMTLLINSTYNCGIQGNNCNSSFNCVCNSGGVGECQLQYRLTSQCITEQNKLSKCRARSSCPAVKTETVRSCIYRECTPCNQIAACDNMEPLCGYKCPPPIINNSNKLNINILLSSFFILFIVIVTYI